jgi:hypothetical protein
MQLLQLLEMAKVVDNVLVESVHETAQPIQSR